MVAGLMACLGTASAQVVLPQSHEVGRYAVIWERTPFVVATEVSPAAESIAKRFAITGFAKLGGDEVVFVFDRKGLGRFTLTKGAPTNGVELVSVTEGVEAKDLRAVVRAQGETAEIAFDATLSIDKGGQHAPQSGDSSPPATQADAPSSTPVASVQPSPNPGILSGASKPELPPRPVRTLRRKPIAGQ
jgi:hypothetical protein